MNNNNEVTESINKDFSELFKSWFTEEELKIMQEKYQTLIEEQKDTQQQSNA